MAKLSKEDLIKKFSAYAGERNDDDTLSLMEDIQDSFGDSDGEDWKRKYEENDAEWRNRYKSRFMEFEDGKLQPDPPEDNETVEIVDESEDSLDFEDIFE